jgi:hypothetical protein
MRSDTIAPLEERDQEAARIAAGLGGEPEGLTPGGETVSGSRFGHARKMLVLCMMRTRSGSLDPNVPAGTEQAHRDRMRLDDADRPHRDRIGTESRRTPAFSGVSWRNVTLARSRIGLFSRLAGALGV